MSKPKTKKDTQRYWTVVNTKRDIEEACCNRRNGDLHSTRRCILTDVVVTGRAKAHQTTTSKLSVKAEVFRALANGSFKPLWSADEADIQDPKALALLQLSQRKKVKTYSASFDVLMVTTAVHEITRVVKECDIPYCLIRTYKRQAKSE